MGVREGAAGGPGGDHRLGIRLGQAADLAQAEAQGEAVPLRLAFRTIFRGGRQRGQEIAGRLRGGVR